MTSGAWGEGRLGLVVRPRCCRGWRTPRSGSPTPSPTGAGAPPGAPGCCSTLVAAFAPVGLVARARAAVVVVAAGRAARAARPCGARRVWGPPAAALVVPARAALALVAAVARAAAPAARWCWRPAGQPSPAVEPARPAGRTPRGPRCARLGRAACCWCWPCSRCCRGPAGSRSRCAGWWRWWPRVVARGADPLDARPRTGTPGRARASLLVVPGLPGHRRRARRPGRRARRARATAARAARRARSPWSGPSPRSWCPWPGSCGSWPARTTCPPTPERSCRPTWCRARSTGPEHGDPGRARRRRRRPHLHRAPRRRPHARRGRGRSRSPSADPTSPRRCATCVARPTAAVVDRLGDLGVEYVLLPAPADGAWPPPSTRRRVSPRPAPTPGTRAWQVDRERSTPTPSTGRRPWLRVLLLVVQGLALSWCWCSPRPPWDEDADDERGQTATPDPRVGAERSRRAAGSTRRRGRCPAARHRGARGPAGARRR